ncbi:D-alanine--poly(phosphoribitol) ligase [Streptomyces anulatus]|uniref:D-alanine--poly(phosphoribitol) ligase n=1 Tax=Streptomyces anulatus TaxID=1892 RepID=UPI0004CA5E7E|nr:D-alanine--poly(phosphoribitol) ligase [Streptomyces anulatus]
MQDTEPSFLHTGFHSSAQRFPDRPALTLDGRSWTYAEVDEVARRWAAALIEAGKRPARVGILGHRSLVTYAGFLAALYAGATVVPLNRKYPAARNKDIAERAGLDVILADDGSLAVLPALLRAMTDAPPVVLPETGEVPAGFPDAPALVLREGVESREPLTEPVFPAPGDVAYLLFTSGSTGRPKGVPITHANVTSFLRVNADRYGFTEQDRFTHTADQTFDLSIFDPFMAWAAGACLVPMDTHQLLSPLGFLREHAITVWLSVPSVAALQARKGLLEPGSLPSLRWSLFCGEALPAPVAEAWQRAAPGSVLENLYGPTEATVACLVHRWDPQTSPERSVNGIVPIGAPYPGMEAVVLAEDGTPVAAGGTGELCLAGPQVFAGYWNAPELTARAFHTTGHGADTRRWYRTGDLGRVAEDGEFVYIGRLDTQVKILGHRIETGEVEAHLLQQEGVAQAVVLAVPGEEDGADVLAAVVSGDGIDMDVVDKGLSESVPPYMIPLTYHLLDTFPLNANGKVDRRALREQVVSGALEPFPL